MDAALSKLFADTEAVEAWRELWREELGEELTDAKIREYGPRVLALVAAVARYRSGRSSAKRR